MNDLELTLSALEEFHVANQLDVARDGSDAEDYMLRRCAFARRVNGNPVVLLLDLELPKVDGFEILHEIETDLALRLIPVVMLKSSKEEAGVLKRYEHGANTYVVKPIGFHSFADSVAEVGRFWAVVNEPPPSRGRGSP